MFSSHCGGVIITHTAEICDRDSVHGGRVYFISAKFDQSLTDSDVWAVLYMLLHARCFICTNGNIAPILSFRRAV